MPAPCAAVPAATPLPCADTRAVLQGDTDQAQLAQHLQQLAFVRRSSCGVAAQVAAAKRPLERFLYNARAVLWELRQARLTGG